jgi:hypothetical protein
MGFSPDFRVREDQHHVALIGPCLVAVVEEDVLAVLDDQLLFEGRISTCFSFDPVFSLIFWLLCLLKPSQHLREGIVAAQCLQRLVYVSLGPNFTYKPSTLSCGILQNFLLKQFTSLFSALFLCFSWMVMVVDCVRARCNAIFNGGTCCCGTITF